MLRSVYAFDARDVATAIRALTAVANVQANQPAVEAGRKMLEADGVIADGAITYGEKWLGAKALFPSANKPSHCSRRKVRSRTFCCPAVVWTVLFAADTVS